MIISQNLNIHQYVSAHAHVVEATDSVQPVSHPYLTPCIGHQTKGNTRSVCIYPFCVLYRLDLDWTPTGQLAVRGGIPDAHSLVHAENVNVMQKIYLFVDFYVDMKILCILFVLYINSQTSKFTITKPQRFMGKKYLGRLFSNLGIWGFTFQLNRKDISVFPTEWRSKLQISWGFP